MAGKGATLGIITAVVQFAMDRSEPERHAPALTGTRFLWQIIAIQRYAGRGPPALAINAKNVSLMLRCAICGGDRYLSLHGPRG